MAGGYKINLPIESFPIENSPAIYGWEKSSLNFASPVRDKRTFLPSLTGLVYFRRIIPSHKWLGYFQRGGCGMAVVECIFLPLGTVLGIFTIVVLNRA